MIHILAETPRDQNVIDKLKKDHEKRNRAYDDLMKIVNEDNRTIGDLEGEIRNLRDQNRKLQEQLEE
jgi:predicted  nucleic acid-binding Zn-ribbon protein